MLIFRFILTLFLLYLFKKSGIVIFCKEITSENKHYNNEYKYNPDSLLIQEFPSHKFRDLKRKSRIIIESNHRILSIWEDSLKKSDELLLYLSDESSDLLSQDSFPYISIIPLNLKNFLMKLIENLIEKLPSYKPKEYLNINNELSKFYKKSHEELLKDYKIIIIRVSSRLIISSILLSSYENIKDINHSLEIGLKYPFLDNIIIKPKSKLKTNLTKILDKILNSIKNFGKKINIKTKKMMNLYDKEYSEINEFNNEELIKSMNDHTLFMKYTLLGNDEILLNNNKDIINILNIFLGKQERDSSYILNKFEEILKNELNLQDNEDYEWSNKFKNNIISFCKNKDIKNYLPIKMTFESCKYLFNKVGELLTGYYYKKNNINKNNRINMLKLIRMNASKRFIQVS